MKHRLLLAFFIPTLLLFGCAQQGTVRLYAGPELAQGELARVEIPVAIDVLAVDGNKISLPMKAAGWRRYQLRPGEHELLLKYEQLWRDEEYDPAVIRSPVVSIRFTAEAGRSYRLLPAMPDSLARARVFSENFRVWLQAGQGEQFHSRPLPASQQSLSLIERLFEPESEEALERLKYWWRQASEEERRRFREYQEAPPE